MAVISMNAAAAAGSCAHLSACSSAQCEGRPLKDYPQIGVWLQRPQFPGLSVETSRRDRGDWRRAGVVSASMRDAEKLVESGVVRPVKPRDVTALLSQEGYKLLDVRPSWEREKAYVTDSYHVPLFIEDVDPGVLTLLKKGIQAGQGGWWMGLKLTTRNEDFVKQVKTLVPERQKLVIACGEGLRSLLAVEELNDAGFQQMAWMAGGFNTARDGDFLKVEGPTQLRFATVGGASEYVLKFAIFIQGVLNLLKGKETLDST